MALTSLPILMSARDRSADAAMGWILASRASAPRFSEEKVGPMKVHVRVLFTALLISPFGAYATNINSASLGSAGSFAVLAGSTVTNTGASDLFGNLGVYPGTTLTGFGAPAFVSGNTYAGGAVASQAQSDLSTAYNLAAGQAGAIDESGVDLGTLTLTPGVYSFSSSAQLTGTLTLNAQGDPNAVFVFEIGSTLMTAANSSVSFINGGTGNDVFWQVGSSATLGTQTVFAGTILALNSITLNNGASIQCGSALAETGAVTLDDNAVSVCSGSSPIPEPSSGSLVFLIGVPSLLWLRKRRESHEYPTRFTRDANV